MADSIKVHRAAAPHQVLEVEAEGYDHVDPEGTGSKLFYKPETTKPPVLIQEDPAQVAALWAA